MAKYLIIFLFTLFISNLLNSMEITGTPKIIDGDSIKIKNFKIRFEGIDAPEIKQNCKKDYLKISTIISFTFKKDYPCGEFSKEKLEKKINNSEIKCISSSKDRYKRYLATCFKGNININRWMVRNGYAVAYKKYSKKYLNDENYAKDEKLGIWKGTFMRPEKWRKLN